MFCAPKSASLPAATILEHTLRAGAIVHVRLARLVYGASDLKGGAAGSALNLLQLPSLNHQCEITRGVRQSECGVLLQSFFAERRADAKSEGGTEKTGLAE